MRNYNRIPNLILYRFLYYSDCTIGRLLDESGWPIAMTMEPPYRLPNERHVFGRTAIPDGVYPLRMEYDDNLCYSCLHVCDVKGFKSVSLSFIEKDRAAVNHTHGNILLGNSINETEGCLTNCVPAFRLLNTYYEQKRRNHGSLCLQVISAGFLGRQKKAFGKPIPIERVTLEDYEEQTL